MTSELGRSSSKSNSESMPVWRRESRRRCSRFAADSYISCMVTGWRSDAAAGDPPAAQSRSLRSQVTGQSRRPVNRDTCCWPLTKSAHLVSLTLQPSIKAQRTLQSPPPATATDTVYSPLLSPQSPLVHKLQSSVSAGPHSSLSSLGLVYYPHASISD